MNILCVFSGQGTKTTNFFKLFTSAELHDLSTKLSIDLGQEQLPLNNPYQAQVLIGSYQCTLFNHLKPLLTHQQLTFAGYSLGEVSAFLASVHANQQELLDTLSFRTQLMTSILKQEIRYDLLLIKGQFQLEEIRTLCEQHHCAIAIVNSEQRLVLGGTVANLQTLVSKLPDYHVTHTQFLEIHLPSHTPFYLDQQGALEHFLKNYSTKPLQYPILSPLQLCTIYNAEEEKKLLDEQLYTTIQWDSLCHLIPEYQFDLIIDLGPGDAMTTLLKGIDPHLPLLSTARYNSLTGILTALKHILNVNF